MGYPFGRSANVACCFFEAYGAACTLVLVAARRSAFSWSRYLLNLLSARQVSIELTLYMCIEPRVKKWKRCLSIDYTSGPSQAVPRTWNAEHLRRFYPEFRKKEGLKKVDQNFTLISNLVYRVKQMSFSSIFTLEGPGLSVAW